MKIDKLYEPFHKSNFPVSLEYKEAIKIAGLDNRNAEEEWRLLHKGHENGDPRASYAIAACYIHGYPPVINRKNFKKALSYLTTAVTALIPHAVINYSHALEMGKGIKRDEKLAYSYMTLALALKHPDALEEIARMQFHGIGCKRSIEVYELYESLLDNS